MMWDMLLEAGMGDSRFVREPGGTGTKPSFNDGQDGPVRSVIRRVGQFLQKLDDAAFESIYITPIENAMGNHPSDRPFRVTKSFQEGSNRYGQVTLDKRLDNGETKYALLINEVNEARFYDIWKEDGFWRIKGYTLDCLHKKKDIGENFLQIHFMKDLDRFQNANIVNQVDVQELCLIPNSDTFFYWLSFQLKEKPNVR